MTSPDLSQITSNASEEALAAELPGAEAGPVEQREASRDSAGFSAADYRAELERVHRKRARSIGVLVAVGVIVAAIVVLLFGVMRLNSLQPSKDNMMSPAIEAGQTVAVVHADNYSDGDVIAYRTGDGIAFSRIIAVSGEWANIMSDGTVLISRSKLDDASAKGATQSDATVVVSEQIPLGCYYVLGDGQSPSEGGLTRSTDIITADKIVGKAAFKVWPIWAAGPVA